jgi:uncharacterized membrane protein YkvA (DUF1232 family)
MWWKIILAVVCGVVLISPLDMSPLVLGFDDITATIGLIASIISMVSKHKQNLEQKRAANSGADDDLNDVDSN